MSRPRQCRYVSGKPPSTYFKPRGIPMPLLEESTLSLEGLEALRLADLEGLTAACAADRMQISRHTFGRVLREARQAVAAALVLGRALCIEGGTYEYLPPTGSASLKSSKSAENPGQRATAPGKAMIENAQTQKSRAGK